MHSSEPRASARAREGGFILALALMMLVALSLIGVATLSTTLVQQDLSVNSRDTQEVYYVANAALALGLEELVDEFPLRYNDSQDTGVPATVVRYGAGSFNRKTGNLSLASPVVCPDGASGRCACADDPLKPAQNRECLGFELFVYYMNEGPAPSGYSIDKYKTYYWKVLAVANSSNEGTSQASVFVSSVYRIAQ